VEHYLYMYQVNYGMNYTVLRYPNVFGPRQDPHGEAGVVAIFSGQMLSGQPVTIFGDGEQQRDFVIVTDCARANLLAVTQKETNGIFNLGAGRGTSINEVFAILKKITQYPLSANYAPAKLGETRRIYLDASKARQVMGWTPTVSLENGLEQTVAYFKSMEMAA
jgi:UDP-glucose 4-epimerase